MKRRPPHKSKRGVSLVELMLATAITALMTLSLLEGFILCAKVTHENAEALNADNVAFDMLWRQFNLEYEKQQVSTTTYNTDSSTSPYRSTTLTDPPSYRFTIAISNDVKKTGHFVAIDLKYGPQRQYTRHLEVFRSDMPRNNTQ